MHIGGNEIRVMGKRFHEKSPHKVVEVGKLTSLLFYLLKNTCICVVFLKSIIFKEVLFSVLASLKGSCDAKQTAS